MLSPPVPLFVMAYLYIMSRTSAGNVRNVEVFFTSISCSNLVGGRLYEECCFVLCL
jgi:hypothetical protein